MGIILTFLNYWNGSAKAKKLRRSIIWSAGITGGICLLLALLGGKLFDFTSPVDAVWTKNLPERVYTAIKDQRASLLKQDSLRSAAFIAAAAVTLWFYSKGKLKAGLVTAILGVLIVLDMWPVDKRYFNDNNFVNPQKRTSTFEMYPYEKALLKDPDPNFRVMNLTVDPFNDSRTSYFLKSVGGYSAVKLRRYNDLIEQHLSKRHMPVVNMLNTKYLIGQDKDGNTVPMLNRDAMGNAWFVSEIMLVDNANQECEALNTVDLRRVAVVDKKFAENVANTSPGVPPNATIQLTACTPKSLDYLVRSTKDVTVVFSEIYYPYGWKATIDGDEADYFRADYVLRAMNVPAGVHVINFTFDPDSVHKGNVLSVICIVLMYLSIVLAAALGIWKVFRNNRKTTED